MTRHDDAKGGAASSRPKPPQRMSPLTEKKRRKNEQETSDRPVKPAKGGGPVPSPAPCQPVGSEFAQKNERLISPEKKPSKDTNPSLGATTDGRPLKSEDRRAIPRLLSPLLSPTLPAIAMDELAKLDLLSSPTPASSSQENSTVWDVSGDSENGPAAAGTPAAMPASEDSTIRVEDLREKKKEKQATLFITMKYTKRQSKYIQTPS
ncbi:hypothetical protein NUW58_g8489 [Xylaria curta]|uniref:Uncharacterized protein n=1 Tax=Xylaria curta TaxID=42375 RepID=A0ACC1N7T4_9PEZI|nr:hypothetical protein NUW58_g8489 [Xylaria curta]